MGSMMVSALYNIVDTYFVSQTGTQATAALGVVFTYMVLIQAFSFFFGQGSGNYISRALGARRTEQAAQIAATGFFSAMFFSAMLGAIGFLFMKPILTALGSTPTIMPYACSYFQWLLLGSPFISCTFVLNNQMRFQGNAAMALTGTMTGAVINMGLDPILIFGFKMGVAGAGLATAISQAISFCIMLSMCGKKGGLAIRWSNFHPTLLLRPTRDDGTLRIGTQQRSGMLRRRCNCSFLGSPSHCYVRSVVAHWLWSRVPACLRIQLWSKTLWPCSCRFQVLCHDHNALFHPARCLRVILCPDYRRAFPIGRRKGPDPWHPYPPTSMPDLRRHRLWFLQNIGATWSALITGIAKQGLFLIPALFLLHITLGLDGVLAAQPVSDLCSIFLAIPLWWKHYRKMDYLEKQKQ